MELRRKKLLLLGGLRYLLPVIEAAHKEGLYVITCDNNPDNVAHGYADEYHNNSIVNKEAVLALAATLNIDGITSFAADPGEETAAYVAEKLGLQFQGSYRSVRILQRKDLFRHFLADNGFNVPKFKVYSSETEALEDLDSFDWPLIVKPVDSAGSKGVCKVESPANLPFAVRQALAVSRSGRVIIEEFIDKRGNSSDSDCFSIDGKLVYCSFSDQWFDAKAENPFTPAAYSWPSTMPENVQEELTRELQRLIKLLDLKTGIYNVETCLGKDGKCYIMEMSPRGGGNRLAEMLRRVTGVDLIRNAVRASVGLPVEAIAMPEYKGYYAEIILHTDREGVFKGLEIAPDYQPNVEEADLWVSAGDKVYPFRAANRAIGTLVLRFPSHTAMLAAMQSATSWCIGQAGSTS